MAKENNTLRLEETPTGARGRTRVWRACIPAVCLAYSALLAAAVVISALRSPKVDRIVDGFAPDPFIDNHIVESWGWMRGEGGLRAFPRSDNGTAWSAVRRYQLPKKSGDRVLVSARFVCPEGGSNRLVLRVPEPRGGSAEPRREWNNKTVELDGEDISETLKGGGFWFAEFFVKCPEAARAAAAPILGNFSVLIERAPVRFHWMAAIFFGCLAAAACGIVLLIIVPEAANGARATMLALRTLRAPWNFLCALLLAGVVISLGTRTSRPGFASEWWSEKLFDDVAAMGNSALLARNGFDVSETFFRSRIRPGLTGWLLPWTTLLPHRLSATTYTPSDKAERLFTYYDRTGWSAEKRLYPEASAFFFLFSVASLLALGGMTRRLGAAPLASLAVVALAGFSFSRCLYNTLSAGPNLATTLAALSLAADAWRRPSRARIALAGAAMSFAMLVKETAVIPVTTALLLQWWNWRRGSASAGFPRLAQGAVYWAVAAIGPLVYYGFILDTGFREIPENHALLRYHRQLHGYESLTLTGGFRTYWDAFGAGLPLATLGALATVFRRRWSDADRFFAAWLIASLWTLTLPYLFTRFLLYSVPPFAWFAVRGLEVLLRRAPRLLAGMHRDERPGVR